MDLLVDFKSKIHELGNRQMFTDRDNPSLPVNFVWTFVGNFTFAAAQWAMLIVLAKLASKETVGVFALGLAITAPVILLTNLNLRTVLVTDARKENQFGDYLALRIASIFFALIVIAGILFLMGYSRETTLIVFMIGVAKSFDALSDILYGYIQQHERMDRIAISRMLQGSLQLLSLGIVMFVTHDLLLAILAWAVASGTVTFLYDIPSVRHTHKLAYSKSPGTSEREQLSPIWSRKRMADLILVALPLGLAVMFGSLSTNIPRYFIEDYLGKGELGIFAAVASFMVVGMTLLTAIGQPVTPRLAKYHAVGNYSSFDRVTVGLVIFGASVAVLGVLIASLLGKQILGLVYTPDYAEYYDLLILLMVVNGVRYSYVYFGKAIQTMREFRVNLPIFAMSSLIVLGASMMLIPKYGVNGAAWAMLLAALFEAIMFTLAFFVVRRQRRSHPMVGNQETLS